MARTNRKRSTRARATGAQPARGNKTSQAHGLLERMITFQELAPGAMVSESELMERTGMGRTPLREALQRLARDRMVEIHPRRGAFIPPISAEVQLKLLELRRAVEELAVRMASHRATAAQKQTMLAVADELEALQDTDDVVAYGAVLKRIHALIVEAAQNEYLQLAMAPLQGLSRRFWFANLRDVHAELREGSRLHAATLRAIGHGDENAAAGASLALNDYLTEFAYRTLKRVPERSGTA
jgi:DNA-binding GntR family transcriptional regulator